jgi:hypothetical protein
VSFDSGQRLVVNGTETDSVGLKQTEILYVMSVICYSFSSYLSYRCPIRVTGAAFNSAQRWLSKGAETKSIALKLGKLAFWLNLILGFKHIYSTEMSSWLNGRVASSKSKIRKKFVKIKIKISQYATYPDPLNCTNYN